MPGYEYLSDDGDMVLLVRPVDQRDAPVLVAGKRYRRRTVPTRVSVGVGARPPTMGERLGKGYKALEDQGKLKNDPNYLPVETIKKAMALPDVHETPAEKASRLAEA